MIARGVHAGLTSAVAAALGLAVLAFPAPAQVEPGDVLDAVYVGGGATPGLYNGVDLSDHFGGAVSWGWGGDSATWLVGSQRDSDQTSVLSIGAVWRLDLRPDGTVGGGRKYGRLSGDLGKALWHSGKFGSAVAPIHDLDGDGLGELLVGAAADGEADTSAGALWIVFPDARGEPKSQVKITTGTVLLPAGYYSKGLFGWSVAPIGDLDGDGLHEVAVGERSYSDPGPVTGAVRILFLGPGGTLRDAVRISNGSGGFAGGLDHGDYFGTAVCPLGDLDGDGLLELAIGAPGDDDGGADRGAVWVVSLGRDGLVESQAKLSGAAGALPVELDDDDSFGEALSPLGDLAGDGVFVLAVGAPNDDDGGEDRGAVWLLGLATDGTLTRTRKLSAVTEALLAGLTDDERFGGELSPVGGPPGRLLAGVPYYVDLDVSWHQSIGGVWGLQLDAAGAVTEADRLTVSDSAFLAGTLSGGLGYAMSPYLDEGVDAPTGDVLVCTSVKFGRLEIHPDGHGSLPGPLFLPDGFGSTASAWLEDLAMAPLGDLDGDGIEDVALGLPTDHVAGHDMGSVQIVFGAADGGVAASVTLASGIGGMPQIPSVKAAFGAAIAPLGDLDGDGVMDLAVGSPGDDGPDWAPTPGTGAVWLLRMRPGGTVKLAQRIGSLEEGLIAGPQHGGGFGRSVAALGDLDGDGYDDLAVGAPGLDSLSSQTGGVWILFLGPGGVVRSASVIADGLGGMPLGVQPDLFGKPLAVSRDLDGDGVPDLAVGAPNVGSYPLDGSVWLLFLNRDGTLKAWREHTPVSLGLEPPFPSTTILNFGRSIAFTGRSGAVSLPGGGQAHGQWLLAGVPSSPGSAWALLVATGHAGLPDSPPRR